MTIHFYRHQDGFGCFSNFSRHQVEIYGRRWMTSEHAFQAMKFSPHRTDLIDYVAGAKDPMTAATRGRDTSLPLRPDWDSDPSIVMAEALGPVMRMNPQDDLVRHDPPEPLFVRVKDVFMYEVVLAKFRQNADCKRTLLGTQDQILVEVADPDPYWGWGSSRTGHNKLGRILMVVRDVIRRS